MAAELLTQQQIQDAYNIYEKGFECGVPADDGLGFALASLDLSEKMHLKQVAEKCVKKDHEGKEAKVALGTFTEAMHEANARNIESGVDVREMFHRLAKGGKLDIDRVREHCVPLGFRDEDVDNMFDDYAGDVGLVTEESFVQLVNVIRGANPPPQDRSPSPRRAPS